MLKLYHDPISPNSRRVWITMLEKGLELEAKYPTPKMLPSNPKDLAIVKMVELVTANELLSAMMPLALVIFNCFLFVSFFKTLLPTIPKHNLFLMQNAIAT
jgi:glutathione S-transferase